MKFVKRLILISFISVLCFQVKAQEYEVFSLYDTVPNSVLSSSYKEEMEKDKGRLSWIIKVTDPELWYFKPDTLNSTKSAVVIVAECSPFLLIAENQVFNSTLNF